MVSRALRLIGAGYLDDHGLGQLARELHVGERHLRRLFAAHLGASPQSVAAHRRLRAARLLVDSTDLPMARVAMQAGFRSLRRFNAAMKAAFGRPPSELRRLRRPGAGDGVGLRLSYRPPLAWHELLEFLARRAVQGVESVADGVYRRALAGGHLEAWHEAEGVVALRVAVARDTELGELSAGARRLFDLDADPAHIAAGLGADSALAPLVGRLLGVRVPGCFDGFELAVRAVLGQQVTVSGASALAGRIVAEHGEPVETGRKDLSHLFPRPEALADAALPGMPRSRARAIRALAAAVRDGALVLDGTADPDATVARLQALPGIGPWTAQYVAMRALREPDAWPGSDLGLRKALARTGARPQASWSPWRAYAAMLLWHSLGDAQPERIAA